MREEGVTPCVYAAAPRYAMQAEVQYHAAEANRFIIRYHALSHAVAVHTDVAHDHFISVVARSYFA